jgi:hypothetical protein
MEFIENNNYIGADDVEDGKSEQINTSHQLDTIARKLRHGTLSSVAFMSIGKDEDKKKPKFCHLITAINTVYALIKASNNMPIFMISDGNYDWEDSHGFYFFIGHHEDIKNKLLKLCEDSINLKDNDRNW